MEAKERWLEAGKVLGRKEVVEKLQPLMDTLGLLDFDLIDTAGTIKLIQSLLYVWQELKKEIEK